jgi:hypothetical protein
MHCKAGPCACQHVSGQVSGIRCKEFQGIDNFRVLQQRLVVSVIQFFHGDDLFIGASGKETVKIVCVR